MFGVEEYYRLKNVKDFWIFLKFLLQKRVYFYILGF
jgi:hypothetical protein